MTTRREFVQALAATTAAAPAFRSFLAPVLHPLPLGVQLYTVRASMQLDVEGTLARVREIGYAEVEFAGYFGRTPTQIKTALRRNGLSSPAAHVGLDALTTGLEATLDAAAEVGHRWLVLPWIDQKDRTLEGIARIAGQLNLAGDRAARYGIRVAYHNHDFELRPFPDGTTPLGELITRLDPTHCDVELDLYWVVKGGSEARTWFERFPGRFPMVHVKDAGPAPDFVMRDVGAGAMDWEGIFAQRRLAGIRHYFIEHDEPADPWASIRASYRYLSRLHL
jgi:sugar phosphate isomerase/epimerase